MKDRKRMYVGSEIGLVVMTQTDAHWEQEAVALKDKSINMVATPQRGNVVYACVPKEGVFASKDSGKSWDLVFPGKVHTLAVDPRQPKVVYAGTEPVHLFRSDDTGEHWIEVEGLQRVPEEARDRWWFPIYPHDSHVRSIFVDWHDSRIICVGLEHGGIFRTVDGGDNWEDLSAGIEYLDIHMVMGDPIEKNLYYAATARGFYRSENFGRDWILSTDGVSRDYFHDFVALPGSSSTLLVATANGTPPAWRRQEKAQAAIYRSNDSGLSWHLLNGGLHENMERMVWSIFRDPQDDDSIYASIGDYTPHLSDGETGYGEVWSSHDRGNRWQKIHRGEGPIRSVCVDIQ